MSSTRDAQLTDRVRALVVDVADDFAVEVLDVTVGGQGPRRVVRVTADAASLDPTVSLDVDTIASLSHRIGAQLDATDLIPGTYTLEVTSPGVDRPLRSTRDFARNLGRDVRLVPKDSGAAPVVGTLVAVDDATVTLDTDGHNSVHDRAEVDHGTIVLPW